MVTYGYSSFKFYILLFVLTTMTFGLSAQGIAINNDGSPPDSSAILDIKSNIGGVLVPRMTTGERSAISSPATGLLVYDIETNSFWCYAGSTWIEVVSGFVPMLSDADGDTRVQVEQSADDDIIRLVTRDNEIFRLDSTGHIGIRDSMPEEALTLKGGNLLQKPMSPVLTGSLEIGTSPRSLYVQWPYAFIIDGDTDDIRIIDISNPSATDSVGSLGIGTNPNSVYVSGNYAYVVDSETDDLKVIDISNTSSPFLQGSLGLGPAPSSVYVSGHYAYVTDLGEHDFKIIDIYNPSQPLLTGSLEIGLLPRSLYVLGQYAFVVDNFSDDLKVIDVSDPSSPVLKGSLEIGTNPWAVYVSGRYAYVVDKNTYDLKVIDIADPSTPVLLGSIGLGLSPVSVYASGRYAYVVSLSDLKVIDVSDPSLPVFIDSLEIGESVTSVSVSGHYAYVIGGYPDGLKVIDISGAEMTSLIAHSLDAGNLDVRNNITARGQAQVLGGLSVGTGGIVSEGGAAITNGPLSLRGGSFLQEPSTPVLMASLDIPTPTSVRISGRYVYVTGINNSSIGSLFIVDVSDPSAPRITGSVAFGSTILPWSLYVAGRYAYVVDIEYGNLYVVDISDPATPEQVGNLNIGISPLSIYVSGRYAYVVDRESDDLKVIDVSDPTEPVVVGSIGLGTEPRSVYISGRYAFVVDAESDDLKVIDVSDPSAPSLTGGLGIGSAASGLYVSGSYAYVIDSIALKVIDVSNPTSPVQTGSLVFSTYPKDIFVSGHYVYVTRTNGISGTLEVIDVSNPAIPVLTEALDIGIYPRSVAVSGRYAYVIDDNANDLKVIDISGAEVSSMIAHVMEAGNLQVRNDLVIQGQVQVAGGVNVGVGGVYSDGDMAVSGNFYVDTIAGDPVIIKLYVDTIAGDLVIFKQDSTTADNGLRLIDPLNKKWTMGIDTAGSLVFHSDSGMLMSMGNYPGSELFVDGTITAVSSASEGVRGEVNTTGGFYYYGLYGKCTGGTGTNYGVYGTADGSGTNFAVYAAGDLAYTGNLLDVSDGRLKKEIVSIEGALERVLMMSPRQYRYRFDAFPDMNLPEGVHYGFVAQEMHTVVPEVVFPEVHEMSSDKKSYDTPERKLYGMNYIELIPILTRAIQEQHEMIKDQQRQIDELRALFSASGKNID